jgi:hypothetical protein
MKVLYLTIISIIGIGAGLAALMIFGNISPTHVPSHEWKSFAAFDIPGLNNTYQVGDTARFFVVKNGYDSMPCITPKITLYREEEPNILLVNYTNIDISCPVNMAGNYSMYFPSKTEPFVVSFEKPGSYVLNMSFTNNESIQTIFPVRLNENKFNSSTECETRFKPQEFQSRMFTNGTSYTINYIPVYLMKPNSTAKICTNNWRTISGMDYSGKVIVGIGKSDSVTHDVTITAYPQEITIDDANKTIVYAITASKDANGFYRFSPMFSDCGGIPIAIGYNTTHSFDNDFPWLWDVLPCPLNTANTEITGLTGLDVAYIKKEYRN